ncbi:MAG: hypothetical protein LWX56_04205 [Ignavibacteria bacterium]|nr:hypothetical protein [Ignavibacteria bacterium]
MENFRKTLTARLQQALKAGDRAAIETYRMVIAALDNAQAPPVVQIDNSRVSSRIAGAVEGLGSTEVPRLALNQSDILRVIHKEIDDITEALALMGLTDSAKKTFLQEQITILQTLLSSV